MVFNSVKEFIFKQLVTVPFHVQIVRPALASILVKKALVLHVAPLVRVRIALIVAWSEVKVTGAPVRVKAQVRADVTVYVTPLTKVTVTALVEAPLNVATVNPDAPANVTLV